MVVWWGANGGVALVQHIGRTEWIRILRIIRIMSDVHPVFRPERIPNIGVRMPFSRCGTRYAYVINVV